jgi:cyclase
MGGGATTLTGKPARFERGLHEVAPGTYAWLQPNGAWGEANAGLVVGEGEAMLIDTLWDETLAGEMLAAMSPQLDGAPISHVVNTHSDGDHWWGNSQAPADAEIITCRASREAMEHESSPGELARMSRLARGGRRAPGSLGGLCRQIAEMLAPYDFDGVRLRQPDTVFERELELSVGGRPARLLLLGPAHTPGDTIVHLPDVGVVFAADLLFIDAIPVMWHGPSSGWLAALEKVLGLDAETYVPGHGDVTDRGGIESVRRFWLWLRESVQAQLDREALDLTAELIASPGFEEWREWECPERLLISVVAVTRELAGKGPMSVTPLTRARLFRKVAMLRERLGGRRP